MLKLLNGQDNSVLNIDNFYIDELWSGLDELVFDIPITDPAYKSILEEAVVEYEQPYLVKAIDGGSSTAKVKCQLNVDAFREAMYLSYTNGSDTVAGTIEKVLPAGWMIIDHAHITSRRTIELEAATPLEIIQECEDTYGIIVRYDVKLRQLHIWDPDSFSPIGAFASRDLNLKEVNYKGKSSDFATRLYGYGKDDLSVASINGGKPYVENFSYSDKVISAYWKDERYTVQENLLADMKRKLKEMSVPSVSYSCSVLDLAKTNPDLYGHQNFELMQVVKLVDDIKGQCLNHQVVQYRRYPFYPEKNEITLSTVAPSIQTSVKNLQSQIEKPSSTFRQIMQAIIDNTAASIAGFDGGNMLITQNTEGKPNGIMIMDTDSKETAKKVLWFNLNGMAYSKNGANGPFSSVWSFEQGGFIADWIVAGSLLADRIHGGTLSLGGKNNGDGVCKIYDANGAEVGSFSLDGIKATKGKIGGWTVEQNDIVNDTTSYKVYLGNGSNANKDFIVLELKRSNGNLVYPFWLRANGSMGINLVDQDPNTPAITMGNTDGGEMSMGGYGFKVDANTQYAELYYNLKEAVTRLTLGNNGTEKLRLDSDGMIQTKYGKTGSSTPNLHITSEGVIVKCGSSSRRYKHDESTELGELDPHKLYELPVKSYKYNEDYLSADDPRHGETFIGFIAEDVAEIYEPAVDYDDQGRPESWNSRVIVPALLKLIQEQNERLKELEEWKNEVISANHG